MPNIHCPQCGEEYSDTYRKCPFCQEEEALKKGKNIRRRGKRLTKHQRSRGAGGIIGLVVFLVVLGVVGFVFFGDNVAEFMGIRMEQNGDDYPDVDYDQINGDQPVGDVQTGDEATGGETEGDEQPDDTQPPEDTTQPAAPLTLNLTNFTIDAGVTGRITATGGTGPITWTSSNENIATVEDGAVTGVAGGTVTITATSGEESATCTVTIKGEPWISAADLKLNRSDFTLRASDPPFQLKVSGTDSPVTWTSMNPNVATVDENGVVRRVSKGVTTIVASVDGHELECIVRVS